ncbi:acyl carrier protein [Streptomyces sp. NPDC091377]|uniref:acyl carrier protein n=1 Tax=Streptomyces sp. NPDC091377 TaxID=3365995 RepID=UPI0038047043
MTEQEFIAILNPLMEDITGDPLGESALDATFAELGLDSLSQLEIINRVEENFDCRLDDAVLRSIGSPRALMTAIKGTVTAP